jgi:hypothetical protein
MPEPYEMSLHAARSALQAAREQVIHEISTYPGPISGCDAQFNRLLSDKTRIINALRELDSAPFVPTPRMLEPRALRTHH